MRTRAFVILALAGAALAACETMPRTRADLVRPADTCADTQFTVYFDEGSARLTGPARQLVEATSRGLKPCRVLRTRVVGLADATGTPEANLTLSQRRAVEVSRALQAQGLPAPTFEIMAAGDTGALTADGREDPVRRRAEVYLAVSPNS